MTPSGAFVESAAVYFCWGHPYTNPGVEEFIAMGMDGMAFAVAPCLVCGVPAWDHGAITKEAT